MSEQVADDEERRRATRALRYLLMEALEEDKWGLDISGDDIQLGSSGVHLSVLGPDGFCFYRPLAEPDLDEIGDVVTGNADWPVGAFLARYENVAGERIWGAFARLPAPPEGLPPKLLGQWLTSVVSDVSVLARVHDRAVED